MKSFLNSIQESGSLKEGLKEDNIVLGLFDSKNKILWKIARLSIIPGHDDHVRKMMMKYIGGRI